jgi:hypothetical protein
MARMRLDGRAPELHPVVLAPLSEELGDVLVLLVGRRRCKVAAVLGFESFLRLGIAEQIFSIEIDLDEGLHRHAVNVAVGALEVVDEGGEILDLEVGRGELRIVLERLSNVDQEVARQVAVDDVLLDVDEVIDAGVGLHVLDRLVVHLVPGRGLELDVDAGRVGEGRRDHVLYVVGWRRRFRNATDGRALVGSAGVRPEVGLRNPAARQNGKGGNC